MMPALTTTYKLLEWIPLDQLKWDSLSADPRAIDILLENLSLVNWPCFCSNPHPKALLLLKQFTDLLEHLFAELDRQNWCGLISIMNSPKYLLPINQAKAQKVLNADARRQKVVKLINEHKQALAVLDASAEDDDHGQHVDMIDAEHHAALAEVNRLSDSQSAASDTLIKQLIIEHNQAILEAGVTVVAVANAIDWQSLKLDSSAFELVSLMLSRCSWIEFKEKSSVKKLVQQELDMINWHYLSANSHPEAILLLKRYPERINYARLSANSNSEAVAMLRLRVETLCPSISYISWYDLSGNESDAAIDLLRSYPANIRWDRLSSNPHPAAIKLLIENSDQVHWYNASGNVGATALLKANPDHIDWPRLAGNSGAIDLLHDALAGGKSFLNRATGGSSRNLEALKCRLTNNRNAGELLHAYPDLVDYVYAQGHPGLVEEILTNLESGDIVQWTLVSGNPSPYALEYLRTNPKHINWEVFSKNLSLILEAV